MDWAAVLAIATAVIQALSENCVERQEFAATNRTRLRDVLRNPDRAMKLRFEWAMRRECCGPTGLPGINWFNWRRNKDEILEFCYAEGRSMKDEDIDQIFEGVGESA